MKGKKIKGFTLTEMIVVIAIIGILAAILAPTMSTYYRKSRIKDANANAKMVFNAAQTAAQTYISSERVLKDTDKILNKTLVVSYDPANGVRWSNSLNGALAPVIVDSEGNAATAYDKAANDIASVVNRTVSDAEEGCWTVYISNYIVQGSVAADSLSTNRVGCYTANKYMASDATDKTYAEWLTGGVEGEVDSLAEVCNIYEPLSTT